MVVTALGRDTLGLLELINRRFRVPPQYPESAYRPLGSDLSLEQVLCFKHRRKMAKDIRWGSSCLPCSCCQARNDPAMPGRLSRSWKDWTAGSGCAMRDASSPPRRRRPAQPSIPPQGPWRFRDSSCLNLRSQPLGPALGSGPQTSGFKGSG